MKPIKTFLIGDTHFGHRNIIDYCDRPFNNVAEMETELIKNWNSVVGKNDVVYMLGDFALCGKDKIIEIGNKLNGRKTITLGNHDQASIKTYYEAGFEFVSKHPIIINQFLILSHEPQFIQANGIYANIFAHVHDDPSVKNYSNRHFCASVERIGFTPIDLSEAIAKMAEKENLQCQ